MALSDLVHSGKKNDPHKIHLHGTIKDGKSTFLASTPNALILDFEDGLSEIECDSIPLYDEGVTLDDVMSVLSKVREDKSNKFGVLGLDTCDWFERNIIHKAICAERGVKSIEEIPYAKGYHFGSEKWVKILAELDRIRVERNMMIVLISHSKIERFEDPRAEAFDRYVPRLHKNSAAIINEWCHGVFFVTKKIITKKEDKGFNRTRVRGLDTGDSVMYCTGQPSHVAGNRLGLPAELPLSWAAYAEAAFGSPDEPEPTSVPVEDHHGKPVPIPKTHDENGNPKTKKKETING